MTILLTLASLNSSPRNPFASSRYHNSHMISVLILTRDEQRDLPDCLASVSWSDDIHVFDSQSTDATTEIARAAGAQIHIRAFDDYATHRNAALTSVPFKHPWVFLLDADERPTPDLSREIQQLALAAPPETSAFRVRRRDHLFGTWLKHAQLSPFYIRLVRPERVHYTRAINEVLEVEGPIGNLSYPLDHFPFSKGIAKWVEKHNLYSTMEAELIARNQGLQNPSLLTALRHPDFHTRRLHQKAIFYRLPGRPLLKWLYMVFGRGAILDGAAGLTYATLQAFYEYLIVLKTKEIRRDGA
jgi:glycosyltransferase involved in cell wall biosynthesis